ncbi:cupredoxin superfamily protein [Artemisia annua]|uniref:Cupredoxin superfamily protein n=1 Tax=Artemisia annua TaxID=35608 RepID=A0A2U1N7P3_ARTAN|nr:cupredoxin superfamily protein [Artemisia annua]
MESNSLGVHRLIEQQALFYILNDLEKLLTARTFMYHAHYEQQDSELYGMIRVSLRDGEAEPFSYECERRILLNDWYHKSTNEHATGLSSIPYVWVEEKFVCSIPGIATALYNHTSIDCSPHAIIVTPGKTYRLRIGCQTALAALSFEIEVLNYCCIFDGSAKTKAQEKDNWYATFAQKVYKYLLRFLKVNNNFGMPFIVADAVWNGLEEQKLKKLLIWLLFSSNFDTIAGNVA